MFLFPEERYQQLLTPLSHVAINHLFAKAVLQKRIVGKVYVDNIKEPTTIYIVNLYGMALLFGALNNPVFNQQLKEYLLDTDKTRLQDEWLQVFPPKWTKLIEEFAADNLLSSEHEKALHNAKASHQCIIKNTRVNFVFKGLPESDTEKNNFTVCTTNKNIFEQLNGSVVPKHFWKSAEDFVTYGKGYTVIINDLPASTAYSAFIDHGKLELGIETLQAFKGQGLALLVCKKLIVHCLNNELEPIWACRLENTPSYKLAQKLGFSPTKYLSYYRLAKLG